MSERDDWDKLLEGMAREGKHRSGLHEGAHLSEEQLIGHLQRTLDPGQRAEVVRHLSRCMDCLDALELAKALLPVDALPRRDEATLVESLGPRLMMVRLAMEGATLEVLESDAVVRVSGVATRGTRGRGVAFRRELADAVLDLTLQRGAGDLLSLSLSLQPYLEAGRVSLMEEGRVVETHPLRHGRATFRGVTPSRTSLRLEGPHQILGHIQLSWEG